MQLIKPMMKGEGVIMNLIKYFFEKNKLIKALTEAFPKELENEVKAVLNLLFKEKATKLDRVKYLRNTSFTLLNGEQIFIPYRVYFEDCIKSSSFVSLTQQLIYHCIFTRSSDGYIREYHIKAILEKEYPAWCIPFLFKVCDEYVVQILSTVYSGLSGRDNTNIKNFCQLNLKQFLYSHARMISYWNEFYRNDCYRYKHYIGRKLFSECFGYSRRFEKRLDK
jgi:hypothetical protein